MEFIFLIAAGYFLGRALFEALTTRTPAYHAYMQSRLKTWQQLGYSQKQIAEELAEVFPGSLWWYDE